MRANEGWTIDHNIGVACWASWGRRGMVAYIIPMRFYTWWLRLKRHRKGRVDALLLTPTSKGQGHWIGASSISKFTLRWRLPHVGRGAVAFLARRSCVGGGISSLERSLRGFVDGRSYNIWVPLLMPKYYYVDVIDRKVSMTQFHPESTNPSKGPTGVNRDDPVGSRLSWRNFKVLFTCWRRFGVIPRCTLAFSRSLYKQSESRGYYRPDPSDALVTKCGKSSVEFSSG